MKTNVFHRIFVPLLVFIILYAISVGILELTTLILDVSYDKPTVFYTAVIVSLTIEFIGKAYSGSDDE